MRDTFCFRSKSIQKHDPLTFFLDRLTSQRLQQAERWQDFLFSIERNQLGFRPIS